MTSSGVLLALLACSGPEPAELLGEPEVARVAEAAGVGLIPRAELAVVEGQPLPYETYTVTPVSLQVYAGFRLSGALFVPAEPNGRGVLVAHGHFGEGKSSGESQLPAHAFAAAGYTVLAMDTPGVEEGDLPGRRIHFEQGAHGRALLAAAGTSAMAVQLEGLQAGLDLLEARGVTKTVVTGASGGSVQALYLLFVDPRLAGAVLASFVPMPREARAGGCACDVLPGWPGPDAELYGSIPKPTLWLSELEGTVKPAGLGRSAELQVIPGPHGYERPMVDAAVAWVDDLVGGAGVVPDVLPHSPATALASASVGEATFSSLLTRARVEPWTPAPRGAGGWTAECTGEGPAILTLGASAQDLAALGDFRVCPLELVADELGTTEGIVRGQPYVDQLAGSIADAVRARGAAGVYAVGAWGLPARGAGVPFVVRDPVRTLAEVDEARDPAWVHAPGIWWSGDPLVGAAASGTDPAALAATLHEEPP